MIRSIISRDTCRNHHVTNVVGDAKMTKLFAVYLQGSGFPSQSSEYNYAFECCRAQLGLGDMVYPCRTSLLVLILLLSLCRWTVIEILMYISFSSSM